MAAKDGGRRCFLVLETPALEEDAICASWRGKLWQCAEADEASRVDLASRPLLFVLVLRPCLHFPAKKNAMKEWKSYVVMLRKHTVPNGWTFWKKKLACFRFSLTFHMMRDKSPVAISPFFEYFFHSLTQVWQVWNAVWSLTRKNKPRSYCFASAHPEKIGSIFFWILQKERERKRSWLKNLQLSCSFLYDESFGYYCFIFNVKTKQSSSLSRHLNYFLRCIVKSDLIPLHAFLTWELVTKII